MQCARCSNPLPASGRYCLFCGLPINPAEGDGASSAAIVAEPTPAAPSPMAGEQAPATPASPVAPAAMGQAEAGFVFQEFAAAASPPRPVAPMPAPFPLPPAGVPGYPAGVVPRPVAPAGTPGGPFTYTSMPMPAPPAQVKKRRGRSTGWIILYAFIGLAVLFAGAVFGAVQIGAVLSGSMQASKNAKKAAAMQLYQQVTSQSPTLQDPLTDPNSRNWVTFDKITYSCSISADGLRASMDETNHFTFCDYAGGGADNFALQVQMQIFSGYAGGLAFRILPTADDTSNSLYFFQVTSTGSYSLYLDKNTNASKVSLLTSGITQAVDLQSQANTLMLIVKGATFDFYINGQYVTEAHDTTITNGSVGLLASENTSFTSVLYTNAKFWILDA